MSRKGNLAWWLAVVATSAALPAVVNGATNIAEYVRLAEDADWRGRGTVTVQKRAAINLAGHVLKVDAIAGGFAVPVDATSSSGTVEASTIYSGNAAFLFDDFQSSGTADNGRAPCDWVLQDSNDDANWTTLDSHANETNWVKGADGGHHRLRFGEGRRLPGQEGDGVGIRFTSGERALHTCREQFPRRRCSG